MMPMYSGDALRVSWTLHEQLLFQESWPKTVNGTTILVVARVYTTFVSLQLNEKIIYAQALNSLIQSIYSNSNPKN